MESSRIVIIGEKSQAGTYILRICASQDTSLRFGRFKQGKLIVLTAGDYVYVGSALAERGAASLARRLIRHATRSSNKPPHGIREGMIHQFGEWGFQTADLLPKYSKKLYWHIDFFLDLLSVEIVSLLAIRDPERLESRLAAQLGQDPHTEIIEPGLGASDVPGSTHLWRVQADNAWWRSLVDSGRSVTAKIDANRMEIEPVASER